MSESQLVSGYADAVRQQFLSGHAREHAYRPALERLMSSFEDITAVNDPKRSEHGNPDMAFLKKSRNTIILGYAEAKDIDISLDKTLKSEQLKRYAGYANLFLTNYLEFRFLKNGDQYEAISIGNIKNGDISFDHTQFTRLQNELKSFLEQPPESIRSGKRLAEIMGGKARRIRDRLVFYLLHDEQKNSELEKIFKMMKELLVHDLTIDKFADMYAQTLVYGLFVARYNDKSPNTFTRSEARDLVPASNPFLREFFDHIVGPHFDSRLANIVDELCAVFEVSDVHTIIQKHLRLFDVENDNDKDPIIHFYEDFLKEYDPAERKKMGAYYTPIPVVKFIVRAIDDALKGDFDLLKGLADTSRKPVILNSQGTKVKAELHKVQILDPAVGTATFLNEIIKHIYDTFEGQEGRWSSYVESDLLPRLYGFELMMAPYTIAHLKLGMTLQETGVTEFKQRIGVYLTNTLEEGQKKQVDLFMQFGLAEVVSQEANEAAKIKHERPIMVVVGNPPYSVSSNNKSEFIEKLVADYKQNLGERNIQPLSDDYIKFIRFGEYMIAKNGEGILAMITNNSYLDGLIHRQMRKHLLETFDKIYVLDLHGNSKKKEVAPDGGKDVNIFDIQQGVAIFVAVKNGEKWANQLGEVYHSELYGVRAYKFTHLSDNPEWKKLEPTAPNFYFVPKDDSLAAEYSKFISIRELMPFGDAGIKTHRDDFVIDFDRDTLERKIRDFYDLSTEEVIQKYHLKETSRFSVKERQKNSRFDEAYIQQIYYRPFDIRWSYYSKTLMDRPRKNTMLHLLNDNIALALLRNSRTGSVDKQYIVNHIVGKDIVSSLDNALIVPLYLYHDDGTRTANLKPDVLKQLTKNLDFKYEPEETLDYIYAILHSPHYRDTY
jgi:type I restriction-modification system DNA methylase subunit